ncbi:MAG: LuxR C-terminal-related transcriptional regulator [Anaerolineae bacterium]|jgi:DNA-binding CsgD family transcriptional regulator|nr:LuxR C-terminal-related transcriptional regulator [Anaerolineae bacterium]
MAKPDELTERERDVVEQLLEGKGNKQIARALHISESTVEFHLKNVYTKLGVSSRTELVLKLGKSTVADSADVPVNEDRFGLSKVAVAAREAVSKIGKELNMASLVSGEGAGEGGAMTFGRSIRVCLTKYAEFTGRASRPEFWWFALFVTLVVAALTYISEVLASVFLIAVLLPLLAAGSRRLNDAGHSPWWLLFLLAPVGGLVLLVILWALPSAAPQPEDSTSA